MNRKSIASLLGVEMFIFFNMDMFLSGFPIYVTMLGAREDLMGVLFGAFMLAGMLLRPVFARLGQRYGQKLVLLFGAIVSTLAPWLYLATDSFFGLVFVRMFHGMVPATFITATQLLLMQECGEHKKAVGVGLFGIIGGISMMLMPYVGVFVLNRYGSFAWVLAASAYGAVACFLFLAHVIRNVEDVKPTAVSTQPFPLRTILTPLFCTVLLALGFGSVMTFVSTYALSLGYDNPGQFFSVLAVTIISSRALLALFGDGLSQRQVMLPGVITFVLGLLLLAYPPSPGWVIISAVPIGLGFFGTQGMMMLNITNAVPNAHRSMAAALLVNSVDLGLVTASMLLGTMLTRWSYTVLFSFVALCAVVALAIIGLHLKERPIPGKSSVSVQTN